MRWSRPAQQKTHYSIKKNQLHQIKENHRIQEDKVLRKYQKVAGRVHYMWSTCTHTNAVILAQRSSLDLWHCTASIVVMFCLVRERLE